MNSNVLRIIVFLLSSILISCVAFSFSTDIDFYALEAKNIKIYYTTNIEFEAEKTYKNGVGFYISPNLNNANKYISEQNFDGFEFTTNLHFEKILQKLKAKVIKSQKILINNEEKTIIYAFSNIFNKFVTIDGKKVNVQILISSFENKVGLPLLLGSY